MRLKDRTFSSPKQYEWKKKSQTNLVFLDKQKMTKKLGMYIQRVCLHPPSMSHYYFGEGVVICFYEVFKLSS